MKECVECGKKLRIIEGYRHPVMGKDHLLCKNCFDTVSASVEKYQEFLSQYNGFFKKETSVTEDIQKIEKNIVKSIEKIQNRVRNILTKKASQNNNEVSFAFH
ncbi:MAG: hypothetical protein BV457_00975 [Thermoplasmata archaeon M9B1D]|nr:MAG: hypothetical protein BV457_00975 [Thermoplasmata archaeon M9B1D]PNX50649.1 MAG: hypothetical protein BV456_05960 [Thermoplasmata archaeon M8B2D]